MEYIPTVPSEPLPLQQYYASNPDPPYSASAADALFPKFDANDFELPVMLRMQHQEQQEQQAFPQQPVWFDAHTARESGTPREGRISPSPMMGGRRSPSPVPTGRRSPPPGRISPSPMTQASYYNANNNTNYWTNDGNGGMNGLQRTSMELTPAFLHQFQMEQQPMQQQQPIQQQQQPSRSSSPPPMASRPKILNRMPIPVPRSGGRFGLGGFSAPWARRDLSEELSQQPMMVPFHQNSMMGQDHAYGTQGYDNYHHHRRENSNPPTAFRTQYVTPQTPPVAIVRERIEPSTPKSDDEEGEIVMESSLHTSPEKARDLNNEGEFRTEIRMARKKKKKKQKQKTVAELVNCHHCYYRCCMDSVADNLSINVPCAGFFMIGACAIFAATGVYMGLSCGSKMVWIWLFAAAGLSIVLPLMCLLSCFVRSSAAHPCIVTMLVLMVLFLFTWTVIGTIWVFGNDFAVQGCNKDTDPIRTVAIVVLAVIYFFYLVAMIFLCCMKYEKEPPAKYKAVRPELIPGGIIQL